MRLLFLLATVCLFLSACKDPGAIGAGLLQNEAFTIDFTDALPVKGKTVRGDTVVIYSSRLFKSIGTIDDPIFGETSNLFYINTTFNSSNNLLADPDFMDGELDSIILRIPLSSIHKYGDPDAEHHVEVIQLTNSITDELDLIGIENLSSFTEIPFDETNVIGESTFVPNYVDTVKVKAHINDDIVNFDPHLRIKLDNSFGQIFFDDENTLETDSSYSATAKGFVIRSTPSNSSMIGLDVSNAANTSLDFYYHKDTTNLIYPFDIGAFSHLNVQHEYDGDGSEIEAALNDPSDDQEFLYAESYSGTYVEFDLSSLEDVKDEIINYAALELTLADVPSYDTIFYPPVNNFFLSYTNDEGELALISDITSLISGNQQSIEEFFGGDVYIDGLTGETKYLMNISNFVRNLLADEIGDSFKLTLSTASPYTTVNRSIINGNGSDGAAPKLKLVITQP